MLKKKNRLGDSVDRLSTLPDDILCHILSFLPTKISVSTSILSKRWRSIWAHVPTLDFGLSDYQTVMVGWPNIIRVMSLHEVQTLDSLRLISPDYNTFELEKVIIFAMSRNVKNLDIRLKPQCTLPRLIFTITTLVRLRITSYQCDYKTGGNVHLPCLKWLHLGCIHFQVDEDLPRLLSGCPVLEELILDRVSFAEKKSGCFNVSSSSLKRLTVIMVGRVFYHDLLDPDCRVEINAPALIYLKVSLASKSISVSPMTSLVEANINMKYRAMDNEDDYYTTMVKFLHCLGHVNCLTLSGSYNKKFVDMALAAPFTMFDNLKKLVYHPRGKWYLLGKLLKVANNLKILIVSSFTLLFSNEIYGCWEEQVPACVSSHLKTIRILGMSAVEPEKNHIVRYLLENAKVLEKMEIYLDCYSLTEQRTKLVEFLSSIVRGSEACELVIRLHPFITRVLKNPDSQDNK
ncbi:hypothetical protein CASFOL_030146 [Castilleja foliolosa]|uniref:F-box domain-containing protein n=1 Tax=Castilleja foliolosa TaxID=1961234 RepID=A0ABD3CD07_9LAMI